MVTIIKTSPKLRFSSRQIMYENPKILPSIISPNFKNLRKLDSLGFFDIIMLPFAQMVQFYVGNQEFVFYTIRITNIIDKYFKMVIYGVYIVSKSGGLIFNHDHSIVKTEHLKTFKYPLDLKLEYENKKIVVNFGNKDGVQVGHVLQAVDKIPVNGRQLTDGRDALELLEDPKNYPLTLTFGRPRMTTNEKIFLASMFYPLFAIASQLSPEPRSSGIEILEADTFKLHCFQTLTGVKFITISEPHQSGVETLLKKIYELYADYALKNPFYSLEMPIRCDLFESHLQTLLEQAEKTGVSNV